MNASKINRGHSADFPPFFDSEISRNEPDSCDVGQLNSLRPSPSEMSGDTGCGEAFDAGFEVGESLGGERSSGAGFL